MGKKKSYDYFEAFKKISAIAIEISDALCTLISNYEKDKLPEEIAKIRALEQKADSLKHEMMEVLFRDFLPPIERDDIIAVSNAMDDIIDNIDEVGLCLDIYQLNTPTEEMIEMANTVCDIVKAQDKVIGELKKFKKSKKLNDYIIEVNKIEKKADTYHIQSMKKLYAEHRDDPIKIIVLSRIYQLFEDCCDSVEQAANAAEGLQLKNS